MRGRTAFLKCSELRYSPIFQLWNDQRLQLLRSRAETLTSTNTGSKPRIIHPADNPALLHLSFDIVFRMRLVISCSQTDIEYPTTNFDGLSAKLKDARGFRQCHPHRKIWHRPALHPRPHLPTMGQANPRLHPNRQLARPHPLSRHRAIPDPRNSADALGPHHRPNAVCSIGSNLCPIEKRTTNC